MKSISNLISAQIMVKAGQLNRLNKLVRATLPVECQPHISVAAIRDKQLVIITDSPVWSSRIRLFQKDIMDMLHTHANIQITQILIKQTHNSPRPPADTGAPRHLNLQSATLLQQTAETIDDPELREAMLKLARKKTERT